MVTQARIEPLTVEQFWEQYADRPFILFEGKIVEVSPPGMEHAEIQMIVGSVLREFLATHPIGRVFGEMGFRLSKITLLAPDVCFLSDETLSQVKDKRRFATIAPDLAVEIVSPGDTASEIEQKIRLFLGSGTRLIWVIYPTLRSVTAHYANGTARTFDENGTLEGGDVLPGFSILVSKLFPLQPESSESDLKSES